jgi:hypothetical protein
MDKGTVVTLALSVIVSIIFIILLIFYSINKYAANKALYSMDDVFLQNPICEDTGLIDEQKDSAVSI